MFLKQAMCACQKSKKKHRSTSHDVCMPEKEQPRFRPFRLPPILLHECKTPTKQHYTKYILLDLKILRRLYQCRSNGKNTRRTLYPRIVPGGTGESGTSSPEMDTEETQTEEWVNSLRISAAIRGESLMAACTQSFADQRAATLLGDQQLEARASRTADVSQMEGPDGLLHCAVLRGDHALAARAAQFLVDKRGSNVNSRDEWGR